MTEAARYIQHSEECLKMAEGSTRTSERIMLLHIAETWKRLAREVVEDESNSNLPARLH